MNEFYQIIEFPNTKQTFESDSNKVYQGISNNIISLDNKYKKTTKMFQLSEIEKLIEINNFVFENLSNNYLIIKKLFFDNKFDERVNAFRTIFENKEEYNNWLIKEEPKGKIINPMQTIILYHIPTHLE